MNDLLRQLDKFEPDWRLEVYLIERIRLEYNNPSLRELAKITGKSKSWLGDSLRLVRGLKQSPNLSYESSRQAALNRLSEVIR